MNTPDLSVIICSHNPRPGYLPRVLEALGQQSLDRLSWELVVVDNHSEPPLADRLDLSFHANARVVREDELGLTHARLRGIRETTGEIMVFVDDDNVLAADYLAQTFEIGRAWPQLGVWGGQAFGEWEEIPAEWTRRYWNWIGVREFERDVWSNVPNDTTAAPFGAGMCVRRRVAEAYAANVIKDPIRRSLGRTGARLTGSEDADLAFTACDLGLGNGIFARLKLTHLMPRQRVQEDYLLRLVESLTYSHTLLLHTRGIAPHAPSRSQRLLRAYEGLFIDARSRRFDEARQRGRDAAIQEIARMKNGNGANA